MCKSVSPFLLYLTHLSYYIIQTNGDNLSSVGHEHDIVLEQVVLFPTQEMV